MSKSSKPVPDGEDEQQTVQRLLGRVPRAGFVVVCRCPDGTPQVVETQPMLFEDNQWKPFPSIYWLVCPRLKLEISRLEQQGFIQEVTARLQNDQGFREAYLKGQKEIAMYRMKRAREIQDVIISEKAERILSTASNAGSHDLRGVKCLHSHTAHQLATGQNPIGEYVLEKVGECRAEVVCDRDRQHRFGEVHQ